MTDKVPVFVKPDVVTCHRDYIGEHTNHPVNLSLCTELRKIDEPNGYGKNYPVIVFGGNKVTWHYGEYGADKRDKQYNDIMELYSVKISSNEKS